MSTITSIQAREIYDSRGTPTVEADVILSDGSMGRASVPSGASTGIHEALELRDGGERLQGTGVRNAVAHVNETIAAALKNKIADQGKIDAELIALDGTVNKSKLGANAILAVSMALSKALALSQKQPLWEYFRTLSKTVPSEVLMPVPMMNILNGGRHAQGAADIQEFMIIPHGAHSFTHAMEIGVTIFRSLKKALQAKGLATTVGDEGGFAPSLGNNKASLSFIEQAVANAGYTLGTDVSIGIDAAASEFFKNDTYTFNSEHRTLSTDELIATYENWAHDYPIVSLEDALEQDDWNGYKKLTQKFASKMQVVGDDLFATNVERLQKGIDMKVANAILIKLNQIGTVTETVAAIDLARSHGYRAIVSHRSGETEDTTIADFVVGLSTGQIKTGSLTRSERIAKYNQLLRIEETLGKRAIYPGISAIK